MRDLRIRKIKILKKKKLRRKKFYQDKNFPKVIRQEVGSSLNLPALTPSNQLLQVTLAFLINLYPDLFFQRFFKTRMIHLPQNSHGNRKIRIVHSAEQVSHDWVLVDLNDCICLDLDDTYRLAYGKQWEWDLRHLQDIGNSAENALEILQKYDELAEAMQVAQTTGHDLQRLEIYITLHYQAVFTIKFHPDAPFRYIDTAARMYARGLLESERRRQPIEAHGLTSIGIDMLRYEIWKGPEHTKSYFKSLERYKLSKIEVQRRFAEIDEIDDDFYDELAGAIYNNG